MINTHIHPTAIVDPRAKLGESVTIGPFCIIEQDVTIGDNTCLHSHVVIKQHTHIGHNNVIHNGVTLGGTPQSLAYQGESSVLRIGHHNTIREFATIHRAATEGQATLIGDRNYLMANAHVGHDCILKNDIKLANGAMLGGHCVVENGVFISGAVAVHQFSRIGCLSMVGGVSAVTADVPPYVIAVGRPASATGLNIIGLRRAGINQEARKAIKRAFKIFYTSGLNTSQSLAEIEKAIICDEVQHFVSFIRNSKRGVTRHEAVAVVKESL